MANAIYKKWKEAVMQASSNSSLGGNVKALLVETSGAGTPYTFSASDQFISDIPSGAIIARSPNLSGKTYTNGVFKASNTTWTSVSGNASQAVVIAIDTGVDGTSRLVAYIDTSITGAPVTPNGGDINCNFDTGTNGIFNL